MHVERLLLVPHVEPDASQQGVEELCKEVDHLAADGEGVIVFSS